MRAGRVAVVVVDAKLVAELVIDVSTGVEDAVAEVRLVKVGETELPRPDSEPLAITIPPEVEDVEKGTTTVINRDVRKQTFQNVSIASVFSSWSRVRLTTFFLSNDCWNKSQ